MVSFKFSAQKIGLCLRILGITFLASLLFFQPAFSDTVKYQYDELGRLVEVTDTDGDDTDYTYDPAGNRTNQDVVAGAGPVPNFVVSDAQVEEGGTLQFTVTLYSGTGGTYDVTYQTRDGNAVAPGDYTAAGPLTLTFTNITGTSSQTVNVTTITDSLREDNEMMALVLSAPTNGAVLADAEGTGTILTPDSLNDPPYGGTDTLTFVGGGSANVPLNGTDPEGLPLIITQIVTPPIWGTATVATDQLSVDYSVTQNIDDDFVFTYEIQDPFGATGLACVHVVLIFDEPGGGGQEPLTAGGSPTATTSTISGALCGSGPSGFEPSPDSVTFSINDISATEGDDLLFTVTKSGTASQSYSMEYSTANGTADTSDYSATSGGLTFTPTQTTRTITVSTTADANSEGSETMFVNLANASGGATFTDYQGLGTIDDGGPPPDNASFSIDDVSVTEGGDLVFTVTKSGTATQDYSVDFATADGTATLADSDYTANSGTLTFTSVETTKTITVMTTGDSTSEVDETVLVNLSNPTGTSTITDTQGVGTIINDDGVPDNASFSIDDVSVSEGGNLVFTVTKSGTASVDYSVDFATADGTATVAGSDYTANSGTLTFTSVETAKTITVVTLQDSLVEGDETVLVNLSNPTGTSTITDNQGVGTINDDDETPPSFAIDDISVTEGGDLVLTVTKTGSVSQTYAVDYATADGTATLADNDYTASSGTLTFTGSDTSKTVTVSTTGDTTVENDETVFVNLSNATNGATITDSQGIGTILNDDNPPVSFSVNDKTLVEGSNFVFTVTKSGTATQSHSVDFNTSDGDAIAPDDYAATSGTLTFGINDTSLTFTVTTVDDNKLEADEVFNVTLSNPTGGATISDGNGIGQILDNDEIGGFSLSADEPTTEEDTTDSTTDPDGSGG